MTNLVTNLDFDEIKSSLKSYLQAQSEFTDYDFEGSGITQLLNILALNTHYNAYLANASFNEAFLDSAIKRGNVVSRAKEINYTSRSARCATALINIDVVDPTETPTFLTLNRYTPFNTSINGSTFTFYNIEDVSVSMEDGIYAFPTVKLYEGRVVTNTFVYDGTKSNFEIPNADVDLDTLTVIVQTSVTDTFREKYNFTDEVIGITAASKIFYVQENANEKFEVYFGDGALGKKLAVGNVVTLTYIVSSKAAANVSSNKFTQLFSYTGNIGGNSNITLGTVQNSVGGAEKEDSKSIKFNAPLSLARSKRIITADDHLSAIGERSASVEAISVWGGEDNDPPTYGKVFISLKPYDGYVISQTVKDSIQVEILKKQSGLLVTPIFVDPEYIFISLDVVATYNPNKTAVSSDMIESYIVNNISEYFIEEMSKYKKKFYFSKLTRLIDDTNDSLIGSIVTLKLQKRVTFPFNFPTPIAVNYATPLLPSSMSSNVFLYTTSDAVNVPCTFVDDGLGKISIRSMTTLQIVGLNVGTVDYATGKVAVADFVIGGLYGDVEDIRINFSPLKAYTDIETNRNQIILLDDSTKTLSANIDNGLKVSVVAVNE